MTKQIRISKVIISEDVSDSVVILSNGDELLVSSIKVDWPSPDSLPVVTFTSDILHGKYNP